MSERITLIEALRGITLEATDGDRIGLVGPNGAGKSTLLSAIAGIYEIDSGHIETDGSIQCLLNLSFVIEPEDSGLDNIEYALEIFNVPEDQKQDLRNDIAEFSELGEYLSMPVRTYSTGMQTRLAFSIITAFKSEILLIDEAIGTGDQKFYQKAINRVNALAQSTKILFLASHADDIIRQWCNKAAWIEQGTVRMFGEVGDVLTAYSSYNMPRRQRTPR
ncbi:MAG: ABC transporter ATP-binding protein [Methyloligellaceae bacterium]